MSSQFQGKQILHTERLLIREWTLADVDAFSQIYADPAVMHFIGDRRPRTYDETRDRKERGIDHYKQHGFGMWAVVLAATGEIIGRCGLQYLGKEVEIGWLLAKQHWGNGYAYEAARACLDYGFTELRLPMIIAVADPENAPSLRLMQRLGLVRAGPTVAYGHPCEKMVAVRAIWLRNSPPESLTRTSHQPWPDP